jgi:hypothetical protein
MAFYRATGQAHKPTPPLTTGKASVVTKKEGGRNDFKVGLLKEYPF